ncbi:MAG: four helix bundle protein [Pirellulales bacterium]
MPASQELAIITRSYDFLIWILGHTAKFPRSHRHGLGQRLENHLLDFHDLLIEAKFSADKVDILRRAGLRLEQARLVVRLSKDLRLLAFGSHEHASKEFQELSRQLAAWRRSVERRT